MGSLLVFKSVSKTYPDGTAALRSVSFKVSEGEFVSIIGPSGSCKSTVLRSINRLNTISSGSISFEGRGVESLRGSALRSLRRRIGMIFQNYNLVLPLSVMQNALHGTPSYCCATSRSHPWIRQARRPRWSFCAASPQGAASPAS